MRNRLVLTGDVFCIDEGPVFRSSKVYGFRLCAAYFSHPTTRRNLRKERELSAIRRGSWCFAMATGSSRLWYADPLQRIFSAASASVTLSALFGDTLRVNR